MRRLNEYNQKALCIRLNDTGGDAAYKESVATATNNVHLACEAQITRPRNGDLDFWEPQMTLTYRGQKYDQQKVAGTSDKPVLTYRGVSDSK